MKACILDADSLGPRIDLGPILGLLPDCEVWAATDRTQVLSRIRDREIILSNKVPIEAEHFPLCPDLKFISVLATGTNNVDLHAARAHGVLVSNARDYSTESVVQHTLSLIFALAGNLCSYRDEVRVGQWQTSPFFCYFNRDIVGLRGKNLTIVGYGHQGQRLAVIAETLGMRVRIAARPGAVDGSDDRQPLAALLADTDVLSFHCPLTPQSKDLIHEGNIFQMKKGSLLVNCARGGIVNEAAVVKALEQDHLGGAAFDVVTEEPPSPDHPFMKCRHPNFILTPHIAWGNLESRQQLIEETARNIKAYCQGRARNLL